MGDLRRTPLFAEHEKLGARWTAFAGYLMPLQYQGVVAEHRAVRSAAGLFDVSHMGKLRLTGPQALALLNAAITNDGSRLAVGEALYSPMCNARGGVVDDLIAWREEDGYVLVVNAARREVDLAHLRKLAAGLGDVKVEDLTEAWSLLALQGPRAQAILDRLATPSAGGLRPFASQRAQVAGVACRISRTGYTGEDGFELCAAAADGVRLWRALLEAGAEEGLVPAGFGARDTLRFEAGLPLYGQELDEEHTPLEAGLSAFVKFGKGPFLGREALLRQREEGVRRRLVGLRLLGRGVARSGHAVVADGQPVGQVTSGMYAPWVGEMLAMAYVPCELAAPGTRLGCLVRGREIPAEVVPLPFYRRPRPAG